MSRVIIRLCLLVALSYGGWCAYQVWRPVLDDPWFRADVAWYFGQYGAAQSNYARAVAVNREHPRVPEANLRIAACLHKLGRFQPAFQAYQAFVAKYPTDQHATEVRTVLEAYPIAYVR